MPQIEEDPEQDSFAQRIAAKERRNRRTQIRTVVVLGVTAVALGMGWDDAVRFMREQSMLRDTSISVDYTPGPPADNGNDASDR